MAHNTYAPVSDTLVGEHIFLSIGTKDILKGVTISATRNSITGLLGRNGSGKSTMLQAIFGTRNADDCSVFINGVKTKQPYATTGLVNYLPQKPFLPHNSTINKLAQQFRISISDIITPFPDLEPELHKPVGQLSGGQERLVSILVILLAPTRFSMLDEPFSHIMPLHLERLQQLLLKQKQKKGIIITDHMYRPLLQLSDKLFLMKEGKSLFIRDTQDLVLHGYINHLD